MKLGAKIFGVLSGMLLLYLLLGLLLPGTWVAEETAHLPAPPSAVFPILNRLEAWTDWTPFPESGLESFGPGEGVGSGVRWNDPQYGKGEALITDTRLNERVEYQVLIEDGALKVHGILEIQPEDDGTRIHWVENGDFGWNPLMGYAAKGMPKSQGQAMRASLERLADAVSPGSGSPSPEG